MIRKLAHSLIVVFLLLWLPAQGVAAAAMPYCEPAHVQDAVPHHAMSGMTGDHCPQPEDHHPEKSSLFCDNCPLCHLGSSPGLLNAGPASLLVIGKSSQSSLPGRLAQVFLEQPQRPPLGSRA